MFCTSCGSQNPDGNKFCVNCGAVLQATEPVSDYAPFEPEAKANPVTPPVNPNPVSYTYQPNKSFAGMSEFANGYATKALSFAIAGIVSDCTFFLCFLGIIFGIVGIVYVGKARKEGYVGPKPIVAKSISIGSIALGGFMSIYLILFIIAAISEMM